MGALPDIAHPAASEEEARDVSTAVILAAGDGTRLRGDGPIVPKPLTVLGGLTLLERTILGLAQSGMQTFRVVVGAHSTALRTAVQQSKRLRDLDITMVTCEDYARGNGASLAAGVEGLDGPFLVAMADHVMAPATIQQFLTAVAATPDLPLLATDPTLNNCFDLDDATKVAVDGHRIAAIGKALHHFDQIDTGLFYFPAGSAARIGEAYSAGATGVTAIVESLNASEGFFVAPIADAAWQDVDTPDMVEEANRRLYRGLKKSTDGVVSKYFNRPISTAITRLLVPLGVTPNAVTTAVFVLSLVAVYWAGQPNYFWIAMSGLLFQFCSIVDGCDGEISRLTLRQTKFGGWYDTITDQIRYVLYLLALGWGAYRLHGNIAYLWAIGLFPFVTTYLCVTMARFTASVSRQTNLAVTAKVEEGIGDGGWWARLILPLRVLVKQDVTAFVACALAVCGLPGTMFWIACAAVLAMTISVTRAVSKPIAGVAAFETHGKTFLFYLLGLSLLAYLVGQMPVEQILGSLVDIGANVWLVIAVAPPLWFAFNSLSLSTLIRHRVGFLDLFYNQLVGEAINAIVPLAGLAGEPYKAKHLSNWLSLQESSQAIVQNKLVHAISGPLFAALLGALTLIAVPLDTTLHTAFCIGTVLLFAASVGLTLVAASKAPTRLTGFVLTRLKIVARFQGERVDLRLFAISLFHKMVGRSLVLVEVIMLLYLLAIPITGANILVIESFIALTAVVFMVVPQGIGVNEMGIAGAFAALGLEPHLAMTFALIRRGRILFWALMGILLHMVVSLVHHANRAAAQGDLGSEPH
jgi:1L-myo-inositol 1-phosphate cytidylyltransferase / CDP-L-myo-inositol myo-inositolphosphotransferase